MKYIMLLIAIALSFPTSVYAIKEIKEVCINKTDNTGKPTQECRKIKVHKKLEGTSVPDVKK